MGHSAQVEAGSTEWAWGQEFTQGKENRSLLNTHYKGAAGGTAEERLSARRVSGVGVGVL